MNWRRKKEAFTFLAYFKRHGYINKIIYNSFKNIFFFGFMNRKSKIIINFPMFTH